MLVMYQSGTLNSLFNRWFWNATNQECATSVGLRPLSFRDLSAIVYMMPAGEQHQSIAPNGRAF